MPVSGSNPGGRVPDPAAAPDSASASRWATRVMVRIVANSSNATARWLLTTEGWSSFHTVSAPSSTWAKSRPTARTASPPSRARVSRRAAIQPTVTNSIALTSSATRRWNHSIRTWGSARGMSRPSHSGQSGQARPQPLVRTSEPITISANMSTVVVRPRRAAVRDAVMDLPGARRMDSAGGSRRAKLAYGHGPEKPRGLMQPLPGQAAATARGSVRAATLHASVPASGLPLLLVLIAVAASRLPFLAAGYGTDTDAWRLAVAAREIGTTSRSMASRFPGYPVQEWLFAALWR